MTTSRFGPAASGEFTAVCAARRANDARPFAPAATTPVSPAGPATPAAPATPTTSATSTAWPTPATQSAGPATPATPTPPAGTLRSTAAAGGAARSWRPSIPPQHGAWAFLVVPVLCAFAVAGTSPAGWVFLAAWTCAYPVGYYAGRALTARVRRGSWTRLARRELGRAVPWALATALLGLPLALTRPWLLPAAAALGVLWGVGLAVAARLGERSLANDLLLVAQAIAALPLAVAVVAGPAALLDGLARPTLICTALVAAYLAGSVLHVKSLLRQAGNRRYRVATLTWHAGLVVAGLLVSPWWLLGFLPALARTVFMGPGLRPAVIGAIEAVVAVLVVLSAFAAV